MSLFVGNVSKNVRRQDLVDAFEKFGKCEVNIKVQPPPSPPPRPTHLGLLPLLTLSCPPFAPSPRPPMYYMEPSSGLSPLGVFPSPPPLTCSTI